MMKWNSLVAAAMTILVAACEKEPSASTKTTAESEPLASATTSPLATAHRQHSRLPVR